MASDSPTAVIPFRFQNIIIRAIEIDGEPWFVGKDIAEALGYLRPNDALQQHCKGAVKRRPLLTAGGMQEVRIINEPDLYRLVAKSQLPEAGLFERWVFEEVLPSIRKTGGYGNQTPKALSPAEMLLQMAQLNLEHERRLAATEQQQAEHFEELQRIDAKLDQVAESSVWTSRPMNSEGISHIVKRIGKKHGLSGATIHEVMRQVPYNIKPAGMVRNEHADAKGATYAVFWVADVNKVFARFLAEAKRVSTTQCTHPFIEGRFKVKPEPVAPLPAAS
ncbi:MAG: phage antirepressor [Pseudoxanthomonas spadix]|nr:MAG: phage antirepressor [Pseudoxanthomonas spadix]